MLLLEGGTTGGTSQMAAVRGEGSEELPWAELLRTEMWASKRSLMHLSRRSGCSAAQAVRPAKAMRSISAAASEAERRGMRGMRLPNTLRKETTWGLQWFVWWVRRLRQQAADAA
jgi:hypothetical protein